MLKRLTNFKVFKFIFAVAILSSVYVPIGIAATALNGFNGCGDLPGNWNANTKTCTMTQSYVGTVIIQGEGITLDGAGNTIFLDDINNSINLQKDNVTLKNINVLRQGIEPTGVGIQVWVYENINISNVVIANVATGVQINWANGGSVINSIITAKYNGITIDGSSNVIKGNTISSYGIVAGGVIPGFNGNSGVNVFSSTSNSNTINFNTISTFYFGVYLHFYGQWNTVHSNNFIGNAPDIEIYGGYRVNNKFNLSAPIGGNYYDQFDSPGEGCSDTNLDGFCDASRLNHRSLNNDDLPLTTPSAWGEVPDGIGEVTANAGGVVSTDDGEVELDFTAGAVSEDVVVLVTQEEITNPEIFIGDSDTPDTALAIYDFSPDGTTFDSAVQLTLNIDVSALTEDERTMISIYRHEDTNFDNVINSEDGYVELPGTVCNVVEQPISIFVATCTTLLEHFSGYALILKSNLDQDGDGIFDEDDACPMISSIGFDSDNDGCIDSFDGLSSMVSDLVDSGDIANQLKKSLLSKIENAEKSINKGNTCAAVNQLEAFNHQVNAQTGKKITSQNGADYLLTYSGTLISYYLSLLIADETCS